jgi:hypothetical protein
MGNSFQLPNGNMLVCIEQSGYIYEIDPQGNTIWDKQVNGTVPHAYRYSACYLAGTVPSAPAVSASGPVLSATGGTAYQWYVDGVMIPGATLATYTATVSGSYQAQVVEAGGCRSTLSEALNVVVSQVDEHAWSSWIQVYPNPANEQLNLRFTGASAVIDMIDAQGRVVHSQRGSGSITTSEWSPGVYTLRVQSELGIHHQRVIIQHH